MTTQETPPEQGKSSRIRQVIADYHLRKSRGDEVSERELVTAHPELMPRLAEELNRLRAASTSHPDAGSESAADAEGGSEGAADPSVTATFDSIATRAQKHSKTADTTNIQPHPCPRIGHYEILEILGEGGFGCVYLAKDVDLERPVAIKVAKPSQAEPGAHAFTFLDEARRVALLNHPSIVKILDVSRGDVEAWYLVMEYVDGPSLFEVFREGNLSIVDLVRLLLQVSEGVQHAHSHGILHRDLKPANVLIGKDGRPRIVDFGMALQAREQPFAPRQASGTPYCMSPEQVRGETHRLDARTDLWSLGILLYEGLTGKRPFTDKSVERVFEAILGKDPPPPSHVNPSVPLELDRICLKCISKRMADRYGSASELSADLQQWLDDRDSRSSRTARTGESPALGSELEQDARVIPKGLRSFGSEDAGFFLDLLPGPRNRNGLPESVQFWIKSLENVDHRAELSVLVLYGPSGTGKSSFVKAGVLPRCGGSLAIVVVDAAAGNLERDLLSSLHRIRPDLPAKIDLPRACAHIRQGGAPSATEKVLIVLDQFEQWLNSNAAIDAEVLTSAIRQCDGKRLQCLIVLRSNFWVGITRFMRKLEVPLVEGLNSAHLDLFDARHARKVLTLFGQSYGCLPQPPEPLSPQQEQFVAEAVAQLSQDGWVMPVRLAVFAEMMKAQEWNADTLQKLGGERGIGVTYLEQVFASPLAAPNHRRYRKAAEGVLRALLPEAGVELKGRGRTQHELRQASGLADKPERFNELIEILDSQLRLITPTECVTSAAGSAGGFESSACVSTSLPTFQLTHDYLVPALREWLSREQQATRQGRAQLLLEERDRLWRQEAQTRFLPSLPETIRIVALTKRQAWTLSQKAMLKKSAAHHLRKGLLGVAAVLGVAAMLYAWMPPDPLPIFLDPNQPVVARMDAFDRLDLSSKATLEPALAAMQREYDPQVLQHTVAGVDQFVRSLPAGNDERDDEVKDLILATTGELLRRDPGEDGSSDEDLRAELFAVYSTLSPPEATLQFVTDQLSRGISTPEPALVEYFTSLRNERPFDARPQDKGEIDANVRQTVIKLIGLIDILPAGRARNGAVQLFAELPESRLADLFIQSFVDEPYALAARSTMIYVGSLPTQEQAPHAARLLAELSQRLQRYMTGSGQPGAPNELDYVLANVANLQSYAGVRDDEVLQCVHDLLERRENFQESGVIDAACATFAALYQMPSQASSLPPVSLDPLRETLVDTALDFEARCAAAEAMGAIGNKACVGDLSAVALDKRSPVQLRLAAVQGLAAIGRSRLAVNADTDDIAASFIQLLETEKYETKWMLGEVIGEYATFAKLAEFPRLVKLLSHPDDNLYAQGAVYVFLLRFPVDAQSIVEQTLVQAAQLTENAARSLLPGPERMLADLAQVREFYSAEKFFTACRALAPALANVAALHSDAAVRRLAEQNLNQLVLSVPLPTIDADASADMRRRQLTAWRNSWEHVSEKLMINEDCQLQVRSAETVEQL